MFRFVFIISSLFVMSMSVFGQNNLSKELSKSFRQYDLVKLDNKVVIEKANSEQPIEIQAYGRYFEFVLTPNDLRAKNYRAIESTSSGEHELERTEIITYKGKLTNDIDSEVRFTVTEENIEGFIYTGVNKFFVNQARNFSKSAQKNDVVVYGDDDLIKTVDLSNDTESPSQDIEGKMDYGLDIIESYLYGADKTTKISESAAAAELKTIEVATEADYQWVTQAGGASAANNEILGILNLVDGIYERDLNLSITVTFQHAWTTADSYSAASTSALLDAFLGYWNTNYLRSQYPRDIAHLFTGKFSNQGIAYQEITCRIPDAAYGVTARSGSVNHLITAHEIGHNLGAEHVDNSGSCATSIMIPILSGNVTGFCDASKAQIQTYVATHGSCLTTGGTTPTPTPTPSPTPTPTVSNISGIVSYGTTPDGQSAKFVSGVTLTAAGVLSVTTATGTNGSYSLNGLGAGSYVVTASKAAQTNNTGISLQDASEAAKIAFNQVTPTTNQRVAADATGNGSVSLQDASEIAKRAFNISSANIVGQWKFAPATRTYQSVNSSLTGQNYEAILVGDVTGNWTPPNNNPTAGATAESETFSALEQQEQPLDSNNSEFLALPTEKRNETAERNAGGDVPVSLPNASGGSNTTILIPVTVGNETGLNVTAYDFTVSFDPNILQPASPAFETTGTLAAAAGGYSVFVDPNQPAGKLRVGAFGTTPLSGQGTLIFLRFTVLDGAAATSQLNFEQFIFGEGRSQDTQAATNGSFMRLGPAAAATTITGRVLTTEGQAVFRAKVSITDQNGEVRTAVTKP